MQQICLMDSGERATQLLADVGRFARAETSFADPLLERLPLDQVHPEADASVVTVGAVDRDHVGMPHAYELARFVQNLRRRDAIGDFRLEELQRARVIEPGVERFVDFPECALADSSNEEEMTPALRRVRRRER